MRHYIATDTERTAIYGLGSTASEAIADALTQCRDLTGLVSAPCTQELYDHVRTLGGGISWDEQDGVACLAYDALGQSAITVTYMLFDGKSKEISRKIGSYARASALASIVSAHTGHFCGAREV